MLVQIKTSVTETVEVTTPAYYKDKYDVAVFKVTEEGILQVSKNQITLWNYDGWSEGKLAEVIAMNPATEADLHNAFHDTFDRFHPFISNAKAHV